MQFGLLVLGPLVMLLVFAIIRSEKTMAWLRSLTPARQPAPTTGEREPET
jgi:hypothetical protein